MLAMSSAETTARDPREDPMLGRQQIGERMSRVDTAWLRMDNDVNQMVIVGVWLLRPGVRLAAVRRRVADKLLAYPRFSQRVEEDALGARWVHDSGFDIERHVVAEALATGAEASPKQALQRRVGELAAVALDRRWPLWQMHLVEDHEGGSALVVRVHHCMADGVALMTVMLSITDGGTDPPRPHQGPRFDGTLHAATGVAPPVGAAAAAEAGMDWLSEAVLQPLVELTAQAMDLYGQSVARSAKLRGDPRSPGGGSAELSRMAAQVVQDLASLALMPDDSPTRFKGHPRGIKRVAWGPSVPLDEVKAVGQALNASINDVLLSCVAGALGRYLRDQGDGTAGHQIRTLVPVNLRPLEQAWQLGNRFGLVPLLLPIGMADPVRRLQAVRDGMAALKGSYQPLMAYAVLAMAGVLAKPAQDALLDLFAKKVTAVMTNVPGPKEKLRFCGASVEQTLFWVPQSSHIGMGVSILSYGGEVQFGLMTDAQLCDDPQAVIDHFAPEFERLLLLTLMLPWGDEAST
jgi:WS/DGAT/MGAT family acyltransferase